MWGLSNYDLLALWERGGGLHPLDQGLLALSAALPEISPQGLRDWPLGRRNQALFELHGAWFGSLLQGWTSCARCGEKMEFEIDSRDLMTRSKDQSCSETVRVGGRSFRLPTSRDLAAVTRESDSSSAASRVLERCLMAAEGPSAWSEKEVEEIEESFVSADPMAETRLALRCPACDHESEEILDIANFVWGEIAALARRLVWEVHALASAYGWTEAQILSLSAARRAIYLEMVQA
jgi:hypothetical protein